MPRLSAVGISGLQAGEDVNWYDLLDKLDRYPSARVTFDRQGERYDGVGAEDMQRQISETLHPRWLRKWLHFTPVDLSQPKPCE